MMDRRRFARLIAGSVAAGRLSGKQAEGASAKTALYSSVGGDLTLYSMDVDEASLVKRNTVSLPANIQYAWPHPSRQYFYVVSSGGGPGVASNENFAHAFRIDSATGAQFSLLGDRKSTRLNSSHQISTYAVFFLKKEKRYC